MTRRLRSMILGALVSFGLCAAARAEEDPARAKAASEAFAEAKQLYEARRYVSAVAAFERAYALRPHFMVQCSIARCYENLSEVVKAARYYQKCLDEGAARDMMAARVKASLEAAEAQISWLQVASPGKGGAIHVDGEEVGQAPGRVPLNPGKHVVEVRRERARPASATVSTLGGEKLELSLAPVDLAPAAPRRTEVQRPVAPSEPVKPTRRRLPQSWFWAAAGATVVLAVVGTVLGVQTLDRRSAYEADPTEAGYDAFVQRRLATNLVWAATALAAGGGTLLFFYTDFGGKQERAAAAHGAQEVMLGLGLRGTF